MVRAVDKADAFEHSIITKAIYRVFYPRMKVA